MPTVAITPFKVNYFGTSRKLVCDFLLVNNTNLHPVLHCYRVIEDSWSNYPFRQGMPPFSDLVWGEPQNSRL